MRFLVIDDHARMRATLKAMLCGPADAWRECDDGAQAVDAFREFRPDWVIMDIEMPGVDGLAATRRLRAEFPAANVVMLSNHDDAELRADAAHAGAVGYLRKGEMLSLPALFAAHPAAPPPGIQNP